MSRRRASEKSASRFARFGEKRKKLHDADLAVTLSILDPAGHRLLVVGMSYLEPVDSEPWVDQASVGSTTTVDLTYADDSGPADPPVRLDFWCRACRDQGNEAATSIGWGQIGPKLIEGWHAGASTRRPIALRAMTSPTM